VRAGIQVVCACTRDTMGGNGGGMWCVCACTRDTSRVGQNRINTPYMTVYLIKSLQKILLMHRIYIIPANPRC